MSDVPSDVFREILLRLPAECLLRCRAVCKDWLRTIDNPSFIKNHSRSLHTNTLLLRDSNSPRLYSLPLDSLNHTIHLTRITNRTALSRCGIHLPRDLPTATCHGLILILHTHPMKPWVIWNPLTREYHTLSASAFCYGLPSAAFGLGYDSTTDDYKLVRVDEWCHHGKTAFKTVIHSLKSGSSRMTTAFPCDWILLRKAGVYMNGALYWISEDQIIVLDLGSEEYKVMALPPLYTGLGKPLDMYVDVFDGCLFVSCYYTNEGLRIGVNDSVECLEGWMMHGVWIKLFSIEERGRGSSSRVGAVMRELRPVAYLKSRGHVLLHNESHFYWLDIQKNTRRKVSIHGLPRSFTCQNFRGSLVRLVDNGVARSDDVISQAALSCLMRYDRLKLSVTVDDLRHSD